MIIGQVSHESIHGLLDSQVYLVPPPPPRGVFDKLTSSEIWLFLFPTVFFIHAPSLLLGRSQHLIAFIEEATLEEQPMYVSSVLLSNSSDSKAIIVALGRTKKGVERNVLHNQTIPSCYPRPFCKIP